ncbi:putative ATPase [Paenibacillus sp. RC73]|uniref:hypothetical protein n=1 Tax=Paenibacillus sp. RC73 TaxID=3156250 RepID=UPI0038354BBE
MSKQKSVMTVFAGTNGVGKRTLSMQMREGGGELLASDQSESRRRGSPRRSLLDQPTSE